MRTLEWFIVAILMPAIVYSSMPHRPNWTVWLAIIALLFVLLHAFLEGMHWQMAPAYTATALVLLVWIGGTNYPYVQLFFGMLSGLLLAASLAFSWALPMFRLPKPTGSYPVGTRILYFSDPNRREMHHGARPGNREAVVQLWYPAATARWRRAMYRGTTEASFRSSYQTVLPTHSLQDPPLAQGQFPLLLYNPAWHGFRQRGSFMAQELASHGFVVAAVSHPYNSSYVQLADGTIAHPDYEQDIGLRADQSISLHRRLELAEEELAIQTQDCRFVLDELQVLNRTPGHPLESRLQMDCVGSYGYSFGGAVSVEVAREDVRVRAALELDGALHGAAASRGLNKPVLLLDSPFLESFSKEDDFANSVQTDTATMWKIIAEAKSRMLTECGGMRVIVEGLGHGDFVDQIFMSPLRRYSFAGSVPPKRVARILNAYVLAFFQQTLLDMPSPLLSQEFQPFPEATLQVWNPAVAAIDES